jgi:hypothetical protein
LFSNEIFNMVTVVVVTGAPVTRYLPVEPTAPVMVVAANAFLVEAAKSPHPTIASPSNGRMFLERSSWNIFLSPCVVVEGVASTSTRVKADEMEVVGDP